MSLAFAGGSLPAHAAVEDIEFVSEHLAEVAMDNRFAALPVWPQESPGTWGHGVQAGYSATSTGELELTGPTLAFAMHRSLRDGWTVGGFVFVDDLRFSGRNDHRPLDVLFAKDVPLDLPADAVFVDLGGEARDLGLGLHVSHEMTHGFLAGWRWVAGLLWQQVELDGYSTPYVVLSGASTGTEGLVDYSATYRFFTPFAGLSRPIYFGNWAIEPRALVAVPMPKQGVQGRITGPGFEIRGDTADDGNGKHYGDFSLTLGMTLRYVPWGLDVDLGSAVTQAVLEPIMHTGIDQNVAISFSWHF